MSLNYSLRTWYDAFFKLTRNLPLLFKLKKQKKLSVYQWKGEVRQLKKWHKGLNNLAQTKLMAFWQQALDYYEKSNRKGFYFDPAVTIMALQMLNI